MKTSVLPAGLTLVGDIEGRGDLVVAGLIEGPIELEGALTIEEGGEVRGDVDVTALIVRGVLAGTATAKESIRVEPSAIVVGDARAPRVNIIEGARFRGRVQMTGEQAAAAPRRRARREEPAEKRPPESGGVEPPKPVPEIPRRHRTREPGEPVRRPEDAARERRSVEARPRSDERPRVAEERGMREDGSRERPTREEPRRERARREEAPREDRAHERRTREEPQREPARREPRREPGSEAPREAGPQARREPAPEAPRDEGRKRRRGRRPPPPQIPSVQRQKARRKDRAEGTDGV